MSSKHNWQFPGGPSRRSHFRKEPHLSATTLLLPCTLRLDVLMFLQQASLLVKHAKQRLPAFSQSIYHALQKSLKHPYSIIMPSASLKPRKPLEDFTNEYCTPTPSPPMPAATAKTGPVLRRKGSRHQLHAQLDSSESWPSSHGSIYQATAANVSTENFDWYDAREWGTPRASRNGTASTNNTESPAWENQVLDYGGNAVPASFLQDSPSPKKHTPHKLYPITEQNSLATLRPGISTSTLKCQPSGTSLRPTTPGLNGQKQKSFSLSDLPPTVPQDPESKSPSPEPTPIPAPIEPYILPPVRIPTPPGLPKFNDPSTANYRLPPPTQRFRDRFRPPTAAEREWVQQTVALPRGVVMRGENGVLVRNRFVPIRSGHMPPQRRAHPIMRVREESNEDRAAGLTARPVEVDEARRHSAGQRVEPASRGGSAREALNLGAEKKTSKLETALKRFMWFVGCCGFCEENGKRAGRSSGTNAASAPLFV